MPPALAGSCFPERDFRGVAGGMGISRQLFVILNTAASVQSNPTEAAGTLNGRCALD